MTQILIISNIALETFTFSDLTNQKKVTKWGFHHWLSTPCVTLGNHILVFSGNLLWTNKKSLLIYSNISYLESRTESVDTINIKTHVYHSRQFQFLNNVTIQNQKHVSNIKELIMIEWIKWLPNPTSSLCHQIQIVNCRKKAIFSLRCTELYALIVF